MKNKGITLISLAITIIVLIILAGILINIGLGENGIFNKAKYAKEETNKQAATEKINLKITTAQIDKYAEEQRMPTLKELSLSLGEDKEIEYVTEKSQIASAKYEVGENPNSIYTKLNEYPYEFEINGQLQLASINGMKVATNNNRTMPAPKLLWQNSNPTSLNGFEAQTVNLIENNCDIIEIYYYYNLNIPYLLLQKVIIGNKSSLSYTAPSTTPSNGAWTGYREIFFNSNNSIVFGNGYYGHTGRTATKDDNYGIPIYILGYETGLFK